MHSRLIIILLLLFTAKSPATDEGLKGLREYLKQYKYVIFVPPRQNASLNTVITFEKGVEAIVTSRCIPEDKVPPSEPASVGLAGRTDNFTSKKGVEGSFAQAVNPNIDLSGAFSDGRVSRVTVQIAGPKESHIESKDLLDYVASLPAGDPCKAALTNDRNLVLENLLSIDGIKYTFLDKDDRSIKLDLSLLKALHLSPTRQRTSENNEVLELDTPIVLGYRAWKVSRIPGAVRERFDLAELGADEIADFRQAGIIPAQHRTASPPKRD